MAKTEGLFNLFDVDLKPIAKSLGIDEKQVMAIFLILPDDFDRRLTGGAWFAVQSAADRALKRYIEDSKKDRVWSDGSSWKTHEDKVFGDKWIPYS
jgi:hypothetical protein